MTKTAKFGGTSLSCADSIRRVGEIVRSDKQRRYIVVSAPGKRFEGDIKITDLLYRCASCNSFCSSSFKSVEARFGEIIKELRLDMDISKDIALIKENIDSGADTDYIVSRGEYLSARVFAKYMGFEFVDAAEIIRFKNGRIQLPLTKRLTSARLAKLEYAVIAGFYGSQQDGTIKTFSRGGSDYSGALIAEATGSSVYENWTDVDGFLATDPSFVPQPKLIERLTYDELYRLSSMGAGVLHPCSVFPLKKSGIPINLRNTFNPSHSGTIISAAVRSEPHSLAGIAIKSGCSLVFFRHQTSHKSNPIRQIYSLLDTVSSKVLLLSTNAEGITAVLDRELSRDDICYIDTAYFEGGIKKEGEDAFRLSRTTLITLAGYRQQNLLQKSLEFVDRDGINYIDCTSPSDLILGFKPSTDIKAVVQRLYKAFFLSDQD